MGHCTGCGAQLENALSAADGAHGSDLLVFDRMECAIAFFAPRCSHCTGAVTALGVAMPGALYCDALCARAAAALRRRLYEASPHAYPAYVPRPASQRVKQRLGRDMSSPRGRARTALQVIGIPAPIFAFVYLLRHWL